MGSHAVIARIQAEFENTGMRRRSLHTPLDGSAPVKDRLF
jgi:hypothetical protein